MVKNLPAIAGDASIPGSRRKCQSTPAFLPGTSHEQSSLAGDSPQGHKETDSAEQEHTPSLGAALRIFSSPSAMWGLIP